MTPSSAMFSAILIANRGEIACRIIRTARRLGIRSVAVFSDADRDALHVEMADEAHRIGAGPAKDSYLRGEAILEAAARSGAQAIHPGYGFLSENAGFADACAAAGIVFIGPPAAAIRAMGGKSEAKALMQAAGVPLVPGYHGVDQDPALLGREAGRIGWPVLIKASAGGGGKGMKVAASAGEFAAQLASARREAAASFGDDRVLLEKYLERPRHVEIQIFADQHGNCVYLFDRDCSIQRRHQKVVEEAPAPGLADDIRRAMGEAAVAAARAIGYVGAGTVEFLYDPAIGAFYFMEMNTRLQVEHPVTEMITGQDLVEWQLRVAAGEKLPLLQPELAARGHAIEARIYAEDPDRDFMPQTGRLAHLRFPPAGPHVRIDGGVRTGDAVSIHYDPMLAKLIVWDVDRAAAVRRLCAALAQTEVAGVTTNVAFLSAIAAHPAFLAAELDTRFIERHQAALLPGPAPATDTVLALMALGLLLDRANQARVAAAASADPTSPWGRGDGWRLNDEARETLIFLDASTERTVTFVYRGAGYWLTVPHGAVLDASGTLAPDGTLVADLGGMRLPARWLRTGGEFVLFAAGAAHRMALVDPLAGVLDLDDPGGMVTAPMPGRIVALLVAPGAAVTRGTPLVLMEAMKMECTIKASRDGRVAGLLCAVGDLVEEGMELVAFEVE